MNVVSVVAQFIWTEVHGYYVLSAGQVHRARLKGQDVVIKVQRPGLKDLFDIDLKNLRVIFSFNWLELDSHSSILVYFW